jgi:hypothetical protein
MSIATSKTLRHGTLPNQKKSGHEDVLVRSAADRVHEELAFAVAFLHGEYV